MNLEHYITNDYNINAYIISLKNNDISKRLTERCINSCNSVGMNNSIWYAFDGTGQDIIVPDHLKEKDYINWIKISNDKLSKSEIGLFLTHFSLWAHCMTIQKPIVILEHDAIMIKKYSKHKGTNVIHYLGYRQFYEENVSIDVLPPYLFIKNSYNSIAYTHGYAIDPNSAKNLFSEALIEGINKPIDNFMRIDKFCVIQLDTYAYQQEDVSTIVKN